MHENRKNLDPNVGVRVLGASLGSANAERQFCWLFTKKSIEFTGSRLSTNDNIIAGRDFCHISFIGRHLFCFKNAITGQFLGVNGLNCYYCENCPEPFDTGYNRVTTTHCGDPSPRCSVSNQ